MERNVLLVDDDPNILLTISCVLEGLGYAVTTASNGNSAKNILQSETIAPDVIVADIIMPEGDGIQFLTWLATQAGSGHKIPPVVAISGGSNQLSVDTAKLLTRSLASVFLAKPFTREEMERALDTAIATPE